MKKQEQLRKGVYILPSLFTVSNLFFGFTSLVCAQKGSYAMGAVSIFIAAMLDALDGRIARLTGTESEFGAELDSIVDIVSFGVAPAFLVYHWAFTSADVMAYPLLRRLGWAAAFLFVTCGALRLARFNVQKHVVESRYFVGLPIPAGAGLLAALVLRFPEKISLSFFSYGVFTITVFIALMMVSRVRYRSFKDINVQSRAPYTIAVVIAIIIIAFLVSPATVVMVVGYLYLVYPFVRRVLPNGKPAESVSASDHAEDDLEDLDGIESGV